MKQKIKIMKHVQQPSDEEIQKYMNFDRLLDGRKAALNSARTISMVKWGGAALVISSLAVWLFLADNSASPIPVELGQEPPNRSQDLQGTPNVIGDSLKIETAEALVDKAFDTAGTKIIRPKAEKLITKQPQDLRVESKYLPAEPDDGYSELYDFFSNNLKYPTDALKDSTQGVETISFIINTAGRPEQVEIVNSLGEAFDRESKRLIEDMPAWKPATLNGKPVASKLSLPITFEIQKIKN